MHVLKWHALPHSQLAESRAAYTLLESVLSQTREELNTATEALRLAQRKADRDRDATIAKLDARTHSAEASRRAQDKAEKEAAAQAAQAALAEQQQQRVSPGIVKSEKRSTSPTANAAAAVKADAHAADTSMKVDVADQQVGSSGLTSSEIQELQRLAQYRLDEMDTLRKDKTLLQLEVETMKRRVRLIRMQITSANLATDRQSPSRCHQVYKRVQSTRS